MANQRFIPRAKKRLRVEVNGEQLFTSDVSPGGFCVEVMTVLSPGSDVKGTLRINDASFAYSGRVQWAAAGERRISKRGRMGVRFLGIDPGFFQTYLGAISS